MSVNCYDVMTKWLLQTAPPSKTLNCNCTLILILVVKRYNFHEVLVSKGQTKSQRVFPITIHVPNI